MSEQRLKQVEILLETCAKVAVNNQKDIRSLIEQTAENKAQIRSLIEQTAQNQADIRSLIEQTTQNQAEIREVRQQMASLSEMFVESVGIMRSMQSEIKGLQTENKRILDHLFGENPN
ncbi:hypothetical protein ACN4EE_20160 [Geminocystis sp. CENA526]|uniref:hypothetical protein n=1 Tax=Geminocystis sp. CENA526 TaxID=1355871 RepID=UPI003D6FB696